MTEQERMAPNLDEAGLRNYTVLCLGSLSLLLMALLRRDVGPWSFLPVAIGLLSVWQHWRVGPFLTLITLVILLVWHEPVGDILSRSSQAARTFRLPDWILCMAVLGYMIGQYRLQSLTHSIIPADPRRDRAAADGQTIVPAVLLPQNTRHRDPGLVRAGEIGWVLMALPLCALFAQVAWRLLPGTTSWSGDFSGNWRVVVQGIVVAWVLALALFVARGLLRYLGWRQQSTRQARLTLQDTCWQETRQEQRRISHWLAWARLRRRKERP